MSANRLIRDRQIAHQVGLLRLGSGIVRTALEELRLERPDLAAALFRLLDRLSSTGPGTFTAREAALLADLDGLLRPMIANLYSGFRETVRSELLEAGLYEVDFQKRLYEASIPIQVELATPNKATIQAVLTSKPFQGKVLREWFTALESAAQTRIRDAVRVGMMENENIGQLVRRIVGTRAARYQDGVHGISRRRAEAFVRTAVSHISAGSRAEFFAANDHIIQQVQLVATLDGRTTPICRARDGRVWKRGEEPQLPFHFNERSTYVGYIDPDAMVGNRPFVRSTQRRGAREVNFRAEARQRAGPAWKDLSRSQRTARIRQARNRWKRENIGTVPGKTTYGEWLRNQPPSFQDEVLGPTRGRLFRKGNLPIERFSDARGRLYTLPELRRREAALFSGKAPPPRARTRTIRADDPGRWLQSERGRSVVGRLKDRGSYVESGSDGGLRDIMKSQGFDSRPEVVESLADRDGTTLFRGVTKKSHADAFMGGRVEFVGTGIHGNGYYFADDIREARFFGGAEGVLMRGKLSSRARTITKADLTRLQEKWFAGNTDHDLARLFVDKGRFAAALGYDAIHVQEAGEWVILNRGAMILEAAIADVAP